MASSVVSVMEATIVVIETWKPAGTTYKTEQKV
jgi:hypothetical protein